MARNPKPWYREDRQAWFVTIRGERHNLGADKKEADRLFHELMVPPEAPRAPRANGIDRPSVAEIREKYLDWTQKHRTQRTYDWYKEHIQSFISSLTDPIGMAVAVLKPFHVVEWADKHADDWGDNYCRGAIVAIQRPFYWAAGR